MEYVNKTTIFIGILATMLSIAELIMTKDITWIVVILLWICLIVLEIIYKISEKQYKRLIDEQEKAIKQLSKTISEKEKRIYMKLEDIKILKSFKYPKREKLLAKQSYLIAHNKFKEQIIINKKGYLIDGYTTYILAKQRGRKYIKVKVER